MDFWSRLIGGAGSSPKKPKPPHPSIPQQRLAHFKATYSSLLQIWHNGDGVATDAFTAENARLCLHRVAELLNDDTRGPTPHLCVAFAATSRLLVIVLRIAAAFVDDGITHEALGICSLLIDCEEEAFLEDRGFAGVLPQFVRSITRTVPGNDGVETESALLEVLFGIASRIRLQPEILPVWFKPRLNESDDGSDDEKSGDSGSGSRHEDFPLFYLLLYYVPAEGRVGEFARMGLLYLIECASHSERLERWIVEGDMATLMASGLGALYSQLSRNLALSYTKEETPPILAYSSSLRVRSPIEAETITSPEYQNHLTTFLSSLVFWQDVLEHCSSTEVNQTLLDHFQFLFLQQLLYPSLLESSDVDGGSSVAVLTYLCLIVESIDHPDLIRLTLHYLFGLQSVQSDADSARPVANIRRRKSENLVHRLSKGEEKPSPDLFNLADLILASLGSKSQQTVSATLRLLSVLLRRQHVRTLAALLKTRTTNGSDERRTVGGQEKEVQTLLSMVEDLVGFQVVESTYGKYLDDNRSLLETHPCSVYRLSIPKASSEVAIVTNSELDQPDMKTHVLPAEDPVLQSLLALMEDFFANDIETNLGLTQVLIDLATCSYTRLEGWLLTDPANYLFDRGGTSNGDQVDQPGEALIVDNPYLSSSENQLLRSVKLARREPTWRAESVSPVFAALDRLVRQVELYRQSIPDFEKNVLECRTTIEADDDIDGASSKQQNDPKWLRRSQGTSPAHLTPTSQMGSINERLRSERLAGSESRTGSPRGRQLDHSSTPTLVGRLSRLQISPSRTSSQASSRDYSPSPLRNRGGDSTPSRAIKAFRPLAKTLERRIKVARAGDPVPRPAREISSSETSSVRSESVGPEAGNSASREVSLGHLLTNVVILHEFIMELAALVDVRATLFDEVRFC